MLKQVSDSDLKEFLNNKAEEYNQISFIKDDPICIHIIHPPTGY
jgi:hypothetical protein